MYRRSESTPADPGALSQHLLAAGYFHAARQGLAPTDADDCALDFCETMLLRKGEATTTYAQGRLPESWLQACADHHAQNVRHHIEHINRHEIAWPTIVNADGRATPADFAADAPIAVADLLRSERSVRLASALAQLKPQARTFLLARHCEGKSYPQLAAEWNSTPDAVRMTVTRACKRLRGLLEAQGFDKTEADEYQHLMSARHCGGGVNRRESTLKNNFQKTAQNLFGLAFGNCLQ